jgi:DNA invertase Pin-like site-specific DNA recombinase
MRKHKMPLAYSYVRFSHPDQAKNDSVRRQSDKAEAYCKRRGWVLDDTLTLKDFGVSAFHGKNAAVGSFKTFLEGIKTGRVPTGSVLIVESFDRISRQGIDEGYDLIKGILKSDIKIVTLSPEREFDREATRGLTKGALEIQLILERAAEESETKSARVGSAWSNKRKNAATQIVTKRLPGWIRCEGKKLVLDPEKSEIVSRLFALTIAGNGVHVIAQTFNEEGVPTLGRTTFKGKPVAWTESIVYSILRSRATFGEFHPCTVRPVGDKIKRTQVGNAIPNYYPAAIDEDTFHTAQYALQSRSKTVAGGRGGRRGHHINLLSGLLVDARDGGSFTYKHLKKRPAQIIPVGAKVGKGTVWSSFPADMLETAILSRLREVKASDIQGDDSVAGRKVEALAGRLAELDALIAQWKAKMDDPALVDIVAAKLVELSGKRKMASDEMADAQREASSPIAESWGEFRSLVELLDSDKSDELREKVRSALRRAIENITCLFVGDNRSRGAYVRVKFRDKPEVYREYVCTHHRGEEPQTVSLTKGELSGDDFDLRDTAATKHIEKALRVILKRPEQVESKPKKKSNRKVG